MASPAFTFKSGASVRVEVGEASPGDGVVVSHHFTASNGAQSTHVTCTCSDSATGKSYSTSKDCPNGNNTCDCSTPSSPKIYCG